MPLLYAPVSAEDGVIGMSSAIQSELPPGTATCGGSHVLADDHIPFCTSARVASAVEEASGAGPIRDMGYQDLHLRTDTGCNTVCTGDR